MTWGVDTHIIERFGQAGVPREKIAMAKNTYSFIARDKSPAQFVEILEHCYGPTMNAYEAVQKTGQSSSSITSFWIWRKRKTRAPTAPLQCPPLSCE
jgi:hypothetical protein